MTSVEKIDDIIKEYGSYENYLKEVGTSLNVWSSISVKSYLNAPLPAPPVEIIEVSEHLTCAEVISNLHKVIELIGRGATIAAANATKLVNAAEVLEYKQNLSAAEAIRQAYLKVEEVGY